MEKAIFDLMVRNIKEIPEEYRRYVRRARLFKFDVFSYQASKSEDLLGDGSIVDSFCLPFPVTAVEDRETCTLLADLDKGQLGIGQRRLVIEVIDYQTVVRAQQEMELDEDTPQNVRERIQAVREVEQQLNKDGTKEFTYVRGGIFKLDLSEDWKHWIHLSSELLFPKMDSTMDKLVARELGQSYQASLEELFLLNDTGNFVLERRPARAPKRNKKRKYRYARERPVYTIVKPKQARRIMGLPTPETPPGERRIAERRAHRRRAHTRTLRSERYTKKRGQTIQVPESYIPAVWRGESESVVGGHRYKVILEDKSA